MARWPSPRTARSPEGGGGCAQDAQDVVSSWAWGSRRQLAGHRLVVGLMWWHHCSTGASRFGTGSGSGCSGRRCPHLVDQAREEGPGPVAPAGGREQRQHVVPPSLTNKT